MSHSAQETKRPVRVRFAPSPTGFLHIGGVRAALFNWLFAKHEGGQFLLRIEDTDLERSESRFTQDILASLQWLGLTWDEEPIFQSKRLEVYAQKAAELIEKGFAYRCTCTEADVEAMREVAIKEGKKPMYDRRCRERKDVDPSQTHVIRAKIPLTGSVEFFDHIRGSITFGNADLDDFVLIRSNGAPTYNLSVVVDDVNSQMTHILRGDDHINNTPKQVHLYHFLNYPVPEFAHLPMILGADKKKLSKRHGAVSANFYREEGYLPEALLNFLARLGWSHGDQEIFTPAEMVQHFSLDHVQKSSAVFNLEKLLWLNGAHIRTTRPERLQTIVTEDFASTWTADQQARLKSPIGLHLVTLIQPKVKLLKEMAEQLVPLCTPGALAAPSTDLIGSLKMSKNPALSTGSKKAIGEFLTYGRTQISSKSFTQIQANSAWGSSPSLSDVGLTHVEIDAFLRQLGETHQVKLGDLMQPIRLALTGTMVSASLFELLALLPWDLLEVRLRSVEKF